MLEEKDLQAIAGLIDNRSGKTEKLLLNEMDKRITKSESMFTNEMDKRIAKSEFMLTSEMDKRIAKSESRLTGEMDKRFAKSESMLISELERADSRNEKRFDDIAKDLEELKTIYRISKTENESINILLRVTENLEKRVSELEKRTA